MFVLNTFLTTDSDNEDYCLPYLYGQRDQVLEDMRAVRVEQEDLKRKQRENKKELRDIESKIKECKEYEGHVSESDSGGKS